MNKIEHETAFEERVIHAIQKLLHRCVWLSLIKEGRALPDHHTYIRHGALVHEVRIVFGTPGKILLGRLQRAAVLAHTLLATNQMPVGDHAAGPGLADRKSTRLNSSHLG